MKNILLFAAKDKQSLNEDFVSFDVSLWDDLLQTDALSISFLSFCSAFKVCVILFFLKSAVWCVFQTKNLTGMHNMFCSHSVIATTSHKFVMLIFFVSLISNADSVFEFPLQQTIKFIKKTQSILY